jgi:hypothetical protein
MTTTSSNSSQITKRESKRAPFQPVTRLEQVIIALYEIKDLATRGKSADIVPLIDSVITVTQNSGKSLAELPHVAA